MMIVDTRFPCCPIADETEELRRLILEDSITRFPEWLQRCRTVFSRFHACLRQHIGVENAAHVHQKLSNVAPARRRQVCELEGDHRRLIKECHAIDAQLHAAAGSVEINARDVIRRLENIVALFRRHAALEDQLVREVFGDDPHKLATLALPEPRCPHRTD